MDDFTTAPVDVQPAPEGVDWKTVATDETSPAQPPKRGRGRPKGSGTGTRKPRTPGRSIKDQIGSTLFMMNLAFAFMPDPWRGDALDDVEIVALADALDQAAKTNPMLHRMLSTVLVDGGAMANLVMVGGMIAGRRLARHGIIAEEFDSRLGTFLAGQMGITVEAGKDASA